MEQSIKDRIAKVRELATRGATEGERQAAKNLLDKLMKKFDLSDEALETIHLTSHTFTYSSDLEFWLLGVLIEFFVPHVRQHTYKGTKYLRSELAYCDYVVLDCSYEYFRRHMKSQWKKTGLIEINKCRKAKTKNKLRKQLQDLFFSKYIIASKLCKTEDILTLEWDELSKQEQKQRMMMGKVEGGTYTTQIITTNLLENNITPSLN